MLTLSSDDLKKYSTGCLVEVEVYRSRWKKRPVECDWLYGVILK